MEMEKFILDFDDDKLQDIKIRADIYIHYGLIFAQRTLLASILGKGIEDGITAYFVFINHIECLCRAAGYLDKYKQRDKDNTFKTYNDIIKDYTKDNNINESDVVGKAKISNFKLEILMSNVFGRSATMYALKDLRVEE